MRAVIFLDRCHPNYDSIQSMHVCSDLVLEKLQEVPTRTAVLDSISAEADPSHHILLTLDHVILTPHIAGSFGGELERMGELFQDHLSVRC